MQWQMTPAVIIEAGIGLLLLISISYFPRHDLSQKIRFIASSLLVVVSLWILTHSIEIATSVVDYKAYLMGAQLFWGLSAITLWLLYIYHYVTNERWQQKRIYLLFSIMPVLTIAALATNHLHGLMWTDPGIDGLNPFLPLDPEYGVFYWICMSYIGIMTVSGVVMVFRNVFRNPNFNTRETWTLTLSVVIPLIAAFMEVSGVSLPEGFPVNFTPIVSTLGIIIMVLTFPRYYRERVIPLARHTVFDHIGDAVVVLNTQNRIVDLNPAAEKLAGYTSQKALGLPVEQIWPEWPVRMKLPPPPSTGYGQMVLSTGGEPRTFSLFVYPVTGPRDTLINRVAMVVEITDRIRAEEEARQLQEKAEMSSRLAAIGEMSAGIAHEINNPLTSVIGFSELLMERADLPEDVIREVRYISESSQRVADIVKRLLTFARQTRPTKTSVDINELLENTLNLRRYVLETANIDVVTEYDPEIPSFSADPGQLQQVFLNLIVNAEQSMKKAHGKGKLTLHSELKGKEVHISVKDDGAGIPRENLNRIFEPFFTTKDVGEGTGLGLSVSRSIILEHGGDIWAESRPVSGTTFHITLPVMHHPQETSPLPAAPGMPVGEKPAGLRIIVIDDEPVICKLVETALSVNGTSVETSASADRALELFASSFYDVVLVDIRLPGMSGIDLFRKVRADSPEQAGRFIFITGDATGEDVRSFLARYSLPHLIKPFDINALKATVQGVLESRNTGDSR